MRRVLVVILVALACTSCSRDVLFGRHDPLPPDSIESLREELGEPYGRLGLTLTRGAVVEGAHLALYAKPNEAWSDEQYAQALVPSMQLIVPAMFEDHKDLDSLDLCVEWHAAARESADGEPRAAWRVFVTREGSGQFDWTRATLADVLRIAEDNNEIRIDTDPRVQGTRAGRGL